VLDFFLRKCMQICSCLQATVASGAPKPERPLGGLMDNGFT
jgi:hypothetical protein